MTQLTLSQHQQKGQAPNLLCWLGPKYISLQVQWEIGTGEKFSLGGSPLHWESPKMHSPILRRGVATEQKTGLSK